MKENTYISVPVNFNFYKKIKYVVKNKCFKGWKMQEASWNILPENVEGIDIMALSEIKRTDYYLFKPKVSVWLDCL